MKIKKFDVVELHNHNKATVLEVRSNNQYFVEIVNLQGITIDTKTITSNEIKKVIYSREQER